MWSTLQDTLKGKKTYLISGGTIVWLVVGWLIGKTPELDYRAIIELILAMTIRAGVSKVV